MATKLAAAFLDRVQRSGLISESKLSQLQQELETQGVNLDDPAAVAAALVDRGALTQWQTEKLLQGKHKGFFLGSYRLLRPLGKGGMGAVFLAQHEMMRRQCAIKVLPQTQIDKHSSVLERFYVEAQAVASLDHQNIVRAYDVSKEVKDSKEIHYLVMEYVEGQDAQAMVQESGLLDYVQAAEIIRQTANGLAHAHDNGLIHRDIKPANLLIDKKGIVKILDLGLARFHDDSGAASLTAAHNETVLGTADYLSPEQALNSHNVDQRTDIYSLGCTAYFLLTGHPPFPDGSVAQRLVAHQVKQPKPIGDERADAPLGLTAIVSKMMAKSPEDRFQTAAQVATTLAAWLVQYGGEDWRRQHSEITGDSSIMNLLPQHREPTRTLSSAMSETELELAPLDDESPETDARAASPAPPAKKPKSGSSVRTGRSGRKLKPEATEDVDLSLAEESTEPTAKRAPAPAAVTKSKRESAPPVSLLEELPPLEPSPTIESLAASDPLGAQPVDDPLASLDQRDLMGASESGPSLSALDSHVRLATTRGPSSSSRLKASQTAAERKPKTLKENLQAVGMPILIGIACGLLLVLVILLLFVQSTAVPETTMRTSGSIPPPPEALEPSPDAETAAGSMPDESKTPAAEPDVASPPGPVTAAQGPSDTPQAAEALALTPKDVPHQSDSVPPSKPTDEPSQAQKAPPTPAPEPDSPAETKPKAETQPEPAPPKKTPAKAKPADEPPNPPELSVSQPTKDELLAALTQFAVIVDFRFPGGEQKAPKALLGYMEEFRQVIRSTLEQMVAVKAVDLRIVDDSSEAVMEITVTPDVSNEVVFYVSARLKSQSGEEWVELWSKPQSELAKVRAQAKMSPSLVMQIKRTWSNDIREYFQDFRTQRINSLKER